LSDVRTLFLNSSLIALHSFSFTQKIKDHSSLLSVCSIYKSDAPSSAYTYNVYIYTGFIRGILRGVRYAKSLRVLFLHRRSPSWTTLVLYSRVVFIFNEPINTLHLHTVQCTLGCSDFYFFHILRYNHPSLAP
jgi:hypothetical protein